MSPNFHGHVPPGRIVLIRHGETEWSRSGRHTGRTDIALTREGERRAASLRGALRDHRFVLVATSPRMRAGRTADLAGLRSPSPGAPLATGTTGAGEADGQGPPDPRVAAREVWPELAEWDYGDLEGLTTPQIREDQPGWTIWSGRVPGGESAEAVAARADAVLDRVLPLLRDGDVALVGHGHFSRMLIARWLGLEPARGASFLLEPASISVLAHERETRVLGGLNLRPTPDQPVAAAGPGAASAEPAGRVQATAI
ncbi:MULTISPECIES: histidine phosphatase family protein [unclassified Pseudofrankia]|uniref:histidine phosphatase family protein n=1 Tax=unclassified Pseudofrankia TaxID=2994372 RepID=UPI0008DA1F30|nr:MULTISPECIES: histidine phosphatase family protein [unclassified Pseudofrankia]MDT3446971.1 histidine phosphatase family protein [Pseudofrankia sp. BMG5.37]OHV44781.1 phosphoglycerate mutase [Pseudofrankia sp. BMG5.36]